ncbi:glycosyltransferase [Mycobacterium sp. PS03-16]|uniref:glycosyltransferase family 2 protein n=1 Tax=Mycobacterium sp. PS03-16 TaxID=2559611 RepID=UPI0010744629|nr:glycosyltransferase [Mycobacterium sp. PS03-16]TFV58654.1 glycosyltransferase [Mycobacterium sp. PS03-16]
MVNPVSVCVPAYNAARTLEDTLRSILDQDVDGEILVLDNASDDATGDIARSFDDPRLRVLTNEALLPIDDNWNRTVRHARFDLIKVVCADDVLRPGAVRSQCAIMSDPQIRVCSSRFDVIDEQGALLETALGIPGLLGRHGAGDVARVIVRQGPADFGPTAATMFRRSDFLAVGGFRKDVFSMDVDLFARVAARGVFYGMGEVTAAWRSSRFNLSSQSSTLSKLTDMFRAQHRLARDHPELLTARDVAHGDLRLVKAALTRLAVRTRLVGAGRGV